LADAEWELRRTRGGLGEYLQAGPFELPDWLGHETAASD